MIEQSEKIQRGIFISVEGLEGVGKSTNIAFIEDYLRQLGIGLVVTREPGGTDIAEQIRTLLLSHHQESLCETAELLLVFAARAQHLNKRITPALKKGDWVLCDRFTDATFAYQGAGRGLSANLIAQLQDIVQDSLRPDLTLILDLPVEIGLSRVADRGELDRFESEKLEFFHRVRQAYLQISASDPQRCVVIDASQTLSEVQRDIKKELDRKLLEWGVER